MACDADHGEAPSRSARFCEAMSVAGRYRWGGGGGGEQGPCGEGAEASSSSSNSPASLVDLTLHSYSELWAEVFAAPKWPMGADLGFRCVLNVASGEFQGSCADDDAQPEALGRQSPVLGRFDHIGRKIEWTEAAPWGAGAWVWSEAIEGHSLRLPISEDATLLRVLRTPSGELLDFTRERLRPLTAEENQKIMRSVGVIGDPSRSPSAVILVGPSCSGKTTVVRAVAPDLGVDPDSAVRRDSLAIHAVHAQFAAVVAHGRSNGGIWLTAWTACKPHWQTAKKAILEQACANRRDIIMFARGVKNGKRAKEGIQALDAAGYTVHVIGVYANPRDIIERGLKREMSNGKRYKRDNILSTDLIPENFRGFGPAIAAASGRFKIVLNANGQQPLVTMEGQCLGGAPLPKELAERLERLCHFTISRRATEHPALFEALLAGLKHPEDEEEPSKGNDHTEFLRCVSWPLTSTSIAARKGTHEADGTIFEEFRTGEMPGEPHFFA